MANGGVGLTASVAAATLATWLLSNGRRRPRGILLRSLALISTGNVGTLVLALPLLFRIAGLELVVGTHVLAVMAGVPLALSAISEHVLRGGMPAPCGLAVLVAALHLQSLVGPARPASVALRLGRIVVTERFLDFAGVAALFAAVPAQRRLFCAGLSLLSWALSRVAVASLLRSHTASRFFRTEPNIRDASSRLLDLAALAPASLDSHDSPADAAIDEEALSQLMALGFEREACVSALVRFRGNVDAACNSLLDA